MGLLRSPYAVALALFVGIGGGLFLSLPLFPYPLGDGYSSLLGGFLGAAVTVIGAAWLPKIEEERKALAASKFLRTELGPFVTEVGQIIDGLLADDIVAFYACAQRFYELGPRIERERANVTEMRSLFDALTPQGAMAYAELLRSFGELDGLTAVCGEPNRIHGEEFKFAGARNTLNQALARIP